MQEVDGLEKSQSLHSGSLQLLNSLSQECGLNPEVLASTADKRSRLNSLVDDDNDSERSECLSPHHFLANDDYRAIEADLVAWQGDNLFKTKSLEMKIQEGNELNLFKTLSLADLRKLYQKETRQIKLQRYFAKRAKRLSNKNNPKVVYKCRSLVAVGRQRDKGRFKKIPKDDEENSEGQKKTKPEKKKKRPSKKCNQDIGQFLD